MQFELGSFELTSILNSYKKFAEIQRKCMMAGDDPLVLV